MICGIRARLSFDVGVGSSSSMAAQPVIQTPMRTLFSMQNCIYTMPITRKWHAFSRQLD